MLAKKVTDALEPLAIGYLKDDAVAISTAISLKRIADMLEATIDYNRDEWAGPAIRTQPGEPR